MMKSISSFFTDTLEKVLEIVDKYGYIRVIVTLIIIGLTCYIAMNVHKIEEIVEHTIIQSKEADKKAHDINMFNRQKANTQMNMILNNLLIEANADRCFVLEMHNGTNNIAGLPFIYVDASYSNIREGVEIIDGDYINLNMSRFYFFTHVLNNEVFIGQVKDVNLIDKKFASRITSSSTEYTAVRVIHGQELPIGFLVVDYTKSKPISKESIDKAMIKATQKIANVLDLDILTGKEDEKV